MNATLYLTTVTSVTVKNKHFIDIFCSVYQKNTKPERLKKYRVIKLLDLAKNVFFNFSF